MHTEGLIGRSNWNFPLAALLLSSISRAVPFGKPLGATSFDCQLILGAFYTGFRRLRQIITIFKRRF